MVDHLIPRYFFNGDRRVSALDFTSIHVYFDLFLCDSSAARDTKARTGASSCDMTVFFLSST